MYFLLDYTTTELKQKFGKSYCVLYTFEYNLLNVEYFRRFSSFLHMEILGESYKLLFYCFTV